MTPTSEEEKPVKIEVHTNVHPNTDRSPWGWVTLNNSKFRIATWSGNDERKVFEQIREQLNAYSTLTEQNAKLTAENTMLAEDRDHMSQRFTPLMQENRKLREALRELMYWRQNEDGICVMKVSIEKANMIISLLEESKPLKT